MKLISKKVTAIIVAVILMMALIIGYIYLQAKQEKNEKGSINNVPCQTNLGNLPAEACQ